MIAVTGANGLLGSFIVRALATKNKSVVAVMRKDVDPGIFAELGAIVIRREADVLDSPALAVALKDVEAVIHTAAVVSFNPRKANKIFEVNATGTANVVNACLQLSIPKLVHVSSVAALGRQKNGPEIDEESGWVENNLNSDYAVSKFLAELEIFRGQEEGLSISMVNPSVILAPGDWTKSSAQLFNYVWEERMFYAGGSINYVDVRDVVDIVIKLTEGDYQGQKFIANSGSVSARDFFSAIAQRLKKRAPFVKVTAPWLKTAGWLEEARCLLTGREPLVTRQSARLAGEKFSYSNKKAKEKLGFRFRSLEESLDWCCGEYLRKINTNK